jgi:hypothetical protein
LPAPRPRSSVRGGYRPAVVHAILEPRGLVLVDGIVYPAVWSATDLAPRLGQLVLVGDASPNGVFRAVPLRPGLGGTPSASRPTIAAGDGESGIDVAIEMFPPTSVAISGPASQTGSPQGQAVPSYPEED